MKKILFLIVLLSNGAFCQDSLIHIPRTNIFMNILDGYEFCSLENGIEIDANIYIKFTIDKTKNFEIIKKNITAQNMRAQNLIINDLKDTIISDYKAILFTVPNTSEDQIMTIAYFGDESFMAVAVANSENNDKSVKAQCRAILTLKYDPSYEIDPYENVLFTVDQELAEFELSKFVDNVYFYEKLNEIDSSVSAVAGIGMKMSDTLLSIEYEAELYLNYQQANGYFGFTAEQVDKSSKNGAKYLFKTGHCYFETKRIIFYQKVIIDHGMVIMVFGYTSPNDPSSLESIIKFSESVNFKRDARFGLD